MSHRLRRLTREGHRQLIEDMAGVLLDKLGEIELGSDLVCTVLLRTRKFDPDDIADHLDTARTYVRQALVDQAGLWERLMR
jgi:hypothetical protein